MHEANKTTRKTQHAGEGYKAEGAHLQPAPQKANVQDEPSKRPKKSTETASDRRAKTHRRGKGGQPEEGHELQLNSDDADIRGNKGNIDVSTCME